MIYGYLRVSSDEQDISNQKSGVVSMDFMVGKFGSESYEILEKFS